MTCVEQASGRGRYSLNPQHTAFLAFTWLIQTKLMWERDGTRMGRGILCQTFTLQLLWQLK